MYNIRDLKRKLNKLKKQIEFVRFCMSHGYDEWFTGEVKKLGVAKNRVEVVTYGEEQDKVLYHIYIPKTYSGFFANYNRVLAYLYFSDQHHLTPVVEYDRETMYAEENPVNGSSNPFEYYFDQPGGVSLDEMKKSGTVLAALRENSWLVNELEEVSVNYVHSERFVSEMGRIVKSYIRLNEPVKRYLMQQKAQLLGEKSVLGVHVRGTDFKQNYNGHPVFIPVEEFLQQAVKMMDQGKYDRIFLATDDLNAVEQFQAVFGEKLVYYDDVIRSNGEVTVMKSDLSRKNHHYLLGLEVLRDMMTLADCDGFLAGLSQVSYAVRFQKESYGRKFRDLEILYKGTNEHTNRNCPK